MLQDIYSGRGFAFFDPHGDNARSLLRLIPPHRTRDVVYFSPADFERPIGVNILENVHPNDVHFVARGVFSAFKHIWRDSWGPRMEDIFLNAVSALVEHGGTTLLGVLRLLSDDGYRERIVRTSSCFHPVRG